LYLLQAIDIYCGDKEIFWFFQMSGRGQKDHRVPVLCIIKLLVPGRPDNLNAVEFAGYDGKLNRRSLIREPE
jgi:hypothetical protein